jgi:hypothetical protein
MEGFEGLNTGYEDLYKLGISIDSTTYNAISTTQVRTGTKSCKVRTQYGIIIPIEEITTSDYVTVGFHYYQEDFSSYLCEFILTTYAVNRLYQDKNSGELLVEYCFTKGYSTGACIQKNTWHYIKIKFKNHNTEGIFQVWLDGNLVFDAENVDTTYLSLETFSSIRIAGGLNGYVDNIFVAKNEFPEGELFIDTVLPNADGTHTDFNPSAGFNYECVDEDPLNDTDYVESSTVGHKDAYEFAALDSEVDTIHAVQVSIAAQKDTLGFRTIKPISRISSTDYEGDEKSLLTGWSIKSHILQQNPATASAWSKSEVDGAEFGVKLES